MRRLTRLPFVLAALLGLLALAMPTRAAMPSAAGRDLLVLRTNNLIYGGLATVRAGGGFAPVQLPIGIFDPTGPTLYAAFPQNTTRSTVQAIDAATGNVLRTVTVPGLYWTAGGDYVQGALAAHPSGSAYGLAPRTIMPRRFSPVPFPVNTAEALSALSFNGRWLALREGALSTAETTTTAIVVDTAAMRVNATIHLSGIFGLDAISADGRALYLIQKLDHAGPQAYQVRLYDVARRQLAPRPLAENGDPASHIVRGVAYTRVWSPRGDWLFTLYVQPGHGGAFIHALGMAYRRVHCIMLNTPGSPSDLARFTLAVAPSGATLYAVDAALGRAVVVQGFPDGPHVSLGLGRRAAGLQGAQSGMVMSRDGRTLFVATLKGVWSIDARRLILRHVYLTGQPVSSLALSPDGRRLYALAPRLVDGGSIVALDATTGRMLGTMGQRQVAGSSGLAIARVITQR